MGDDPWAYGLTYANRKNLETVQRYCHQQGLIGRSAPLEELFADTDLGGEVVLARDGSFLGVVAETDRAARLAAALSWVMD